MTRAGAIVEDLHVVQPEDGDILDVPAKPGSDSGVVEAQHDNGEIQESAGRELDPLLVIDAEERARITQKLIKSGLAIRCNVGYFGREQSEQQIPVFSVDRAVVNHAISNSAAASGIKEQTATPAQGTNGHNLNHEGSQKDITKAAGHVPDNTDQEIIGGFDIKHTELGSAAILPEVVISSQDKLIIEIYTNHFQSLVRLAYLLLRGPVESCEDVVQDAFIAMIKNFARLRDQEKALSYLRQSVVNKSRSVLRHRMVVDKNAPKPAPDMPSAEQGAIVLQERSAVIAGLRSLPPRQREALVLKYYGDLSEKQTAAAMGISPGAVKSHLARGVASLRVVLEHEQ